MLGPGKYDDLCTAARRAADADGAILMIIDGARGSGFSAQLDPRNLDTLPEMLEEMARRIRADLRAGKAGRN